MISPYRRFLLYLWGLLKRILGGGRAADWLGAIAESIVGGLANLREANGTAISAASQISHHGMPFPSFRISAVAW